MSQLSYNDDNIQTSAQDVSGLEMKRLNSMARIQENYFRHHQWAFFFLICFSTSNCRPPWCIWNFAEFQKLLSTEHGGAVIAYIQWFTPTDLKNYRSLGPFQKTKKNVSHIWKNLVPYRSQRQPEECLFQMLKIPLPCVLWGLAFSGTCSQRTQYTDLQSNVQWDLPLSRKECDWTMTYV